MKRIKLIITIAGALLLTASVIQNVWYFFSGYDCYLQDTDEIYIMESGILYNNLDFIEGESLNIVYDLENEEYQLLIDRYGIDKIAGEGTELERALRLMNEFSPRLTHKSNYDNHVEMSAVSLLDYSLDNRSQGINCRAKAQILNEMCLALGIYSRKVWILPYSEYDSDCHVVNEIWDSTLEKWVMLDITNNQYWVDINGSPLSVLEIRNKGAMQEFCTPVIPGEALDDLNKLRERHISEFLYIMKNMVYIECCDIQTVGETDIVGLFPEGYEGRIPLITSDTLERSPY